MKSLVLLFTAAAAAAQTPCNLSAYKEQPGLKAYQANGRLEVAWSGERGDQLMAAFAIDRGAPVVRELAVKSKDGRSTNLGHNLTPEFSVVTGMRRAGHGMPDELRWWVYWDAPLSIPGRGDNPNLPRKPEEIRRAAAAFASRSCEARTEGARLEVEFDGVSMGLFAGKLRYTVYRGANLLRVETIAKTEEPSVAYKYTAGLKGFSTAALQRVAWTDVGGSEQHYEFGGEPNRDPVPLRARKRIAVAGGRAGSVAVFPAPHQFFFARQLEINLGFNWYRKDDAKSFSLGVRHGDNHEGYNPVWVERVFALYNAPPGTWQRMPVYFYLSAAPARQTREAALAYTHGDTYKPLPGYKTMVTHFHTAFTKELTDSGSLDTLAPWIPAMRALGVNIVYNCDFHGDGHPNDPGSVRLKELEAYYEACRRHSDRDFLILPGEEANAYLGGHYNILFPKPVFWTHRRTPEQQFIEKDAKYGAVYRPSNTAEVFEMLKREDAYVWQTHPRTKGSHGYPDKIRETDYFRSDHWLGGGWKALPVDLSEKRLCEKRCFDALDDMNNWGRPKYLLAEVDTYKKFPEYDLYGDFNVNYVKLGTLPPARDWSPLLKALREGDFFVSTGEVLISSFRVNGSSSVTAEVEWTFPLEFVEVVWGDGDRVRRKIVPAADTGPFGSRRFEIPVDLRGQKWVRFAAWDSAVNGAFTQPVHLEAASRRVAR
ncbi:MAG: hypothetical protein HYZ57_08560 [Acidobacteria bacterium]|nr:hypothetical protein [Acidobacteriota bacterium]MBI3279876.1 hypothetical protein [Acidobacteriota bacterium]